MYTAHDRDVTWTLSRLKLPANRPSYRQIDRFFQKLINIFKFHSVVSRDLILLIALH